MHNRNFKEMFAHHLPLPFPSFSLYAFSVYRTTIYPFINSIALQRERSDEEDFLLFRGEILPKENQAS
jgi:hypothetical protein